MSNDLPEVPRPDERTFDEGEERLYAIGRLGRMRITREEYEALREAGANVSGAGVTS